MEFNVNYTSNLVKEVDISQLESGFYYILFKSKQCQNKEKLIKN